MIRLNGFSRRHYLTRSNKNSLKQSAGARSFMIGVPLAVAVIFCFTFVLMQPRAAGRTTSRSPAKPGQISSPQVDKLPLVPQSKADHLSAIAPPPPANIADRADTATLQPAAASHKDINNINQNIKRPSKLLETFPSKQDH